MTGTLEVPLWLGVVAGLLAAWAAWDKLLVPALRWFVSSRANRVIDEIGARLKIRIRPFQRTRRQALIHRLATDPLVLQAAERHAAERRIPEADAVALVERYAREIVPAFNAYLYFRIGYWFGRRISRALYRVRLGYVDAVGLAHIDPDATVVFVMNHRSNMDYVLAAYLAADQAALSYAVGEWARRWPLSALVRAMGAYFVRRDSRDALYRRVLEMIRGGPGWRLRTSGGSLDADFCIVATGARNPLRNVGTEWTAGDTMLALGYYVPAQQEHINIQFLPQLEERPQVVPA